MIAPKKWNAAFVIRMPSPFQLFVLGAGAVVSLGFRILRAEQRPLHISNERKDLESGGSVVPV